MRKKIVIMSIVLCLLLAVVFTLSACDMVQQFLSDNKGDNGFGGKEGADGDGGHGGGAQGTAESTLANAFALATQINMFGTDVSASDQSLKEYIATKLSEATVYWTEGVVFAKADTFSQKSGAAMYKNGEYYCIITITNGNAATSEVVRITSETSVSGETFLIALKGAAIAMGMEEEDAEELAQELSGYLRNVQLSRISAEGKEDIYLFPIEDEGFTMFMTLRETIEYFTGNATVIAVEGEVISVADFVATFRAALIAAGLSDTEAASFTNDIGNAYAQIIMYTSEGASSYTAFSADGEVIFSGSMDELVKACIKAKTDIVDAAVKKTCINNANTLAMEITVFEFDAASPAQTLKEYINSKLQNITVVWSGEAQDATKNTIASTSGTATVTYEGYSCVVTIANGRATAAEEATKTVGNVDENPGEDGDETGDVEISADIYAAEYCACLIANGLGESEANQYASGTVELFKVQGIQLFKRMEEGKAVYYGLIDGDQVIQPHTMEDMATELIGFLDRAKRNTVLSNANDLVTLINAFGSNAAAPSSQSLKEYINSNLQNVTILWSGEAQDATKNTIASSSGTAMVTYEGFICVVTIANGTATAAEDATKEIPLEDFITAFCAGLIAYGADETEADSYANQLRSTYSNTGAKVTIQRNENTAPIYTLFSADGEVIFSSSIEELIYNMNEGFSDQAANASCINAADVLADQINAFERDAEDEYQILCEYISSKLSKLNVAWGGFFPVEAYLSESTADDISESSGVALVKNERYCCYVTVTNGNAVASNVAVKITKEESVSADELLAAIIEAFGTHELSDENMSILAETYEGVLSEFDFFTHVFVEGTDFYLATVEDDFVFTSILNMEEVVESYIKIMGEIGEDGDETGEVEISLNEFAADMRACLISKGVSEAESDQYANGMISAYSEPGIEIHIFKRTEEGKAAVYYSNNATEEGALIPETTMDALVTDLLALVEKAKKTTILNSASVLASWINTFEGDTEKEVQSLRTYISTKCPGLFVAWSESFGTASFLNADSEGTVLLKENGYYTFVTVTHGNAVASGVAIKITKDTSVSSKDVEKAIVAEMPSLGVPEARAALCLEVIETAEEEYEFLLLSAADEEDIYIVDYDDCYEFMTFSEHVEFAVLACCVGDAMSLQEQINAFATDADSDTQTLAEYIDDRMPLISVVWSGEAQDATKDTIAAASGTTTVTYGEFRHVVRIENGKASTSAIIRNE